MECRTATENAPAFVHKARVRCKKIRAALRLSRPLLGKHHFANENAWWRNAARGLSHVRDVSARAEALEALKPFLAQEAGAAAAYRLEARFAREQAELARDAAHLTAVREFCRAVAARADRGAPEIADGDKGDIRDALKLAYREARRTMQDALDETTPENVHDWRKKTKSLALQMRLAKAHFPAGVEQGIAAARALSDELGFLQDIEVLSQALGDGEEPAIVFALEKRRKELTDQAELKGEALFFSKPKQWMKNTVAGAAASA